MRAPRWRCAMRWLALRDRLLASPGFQRWAAALSADARRSRGAGRARCSISVAGFVYSQVLFACVRLDLFEILRGRAARRRRNWRARLRLPPDATDAPACARRSRCDLVQRRSDGRFGLGDLGAALLGNPGDRGDDRASRDAVRRPARSGGAAARRGAAQRGSRGLLALCGAARARRGRSLRTAIAPTAR